MEIFGSAFDDSVFLEARARVRVTLSAYNAKLCEPEWFCESAALDTDDSLEKQKVHKFRGDLALRQENYQKALDAYSCCLEWLDDKNMTIKRDVLEGMARCCTKLGQRDRALDLADLLSKDASNTCHLISLLLLKVSIYQHFGVVGPKVSSLQRLCCLLPFNPWHWLNLGQTCLQLLDNGSTSTLDFISCFIQHPCNFAADMDEDRLRLKACTCFLRTRLLLTILRQQQSSFVLQRSERALQTTDEALQRLNPKESTLHTLTEVMSEDLVPEKMREDYQDGESLASVCVQSFRERWWNKILHTGVSETDGDLCRTMPDTTS
uniref:Chromosome 8 open reading frame 76 n=1 Tax=Scophthalmus maximus TaxID=52904 RepID=A0A8D3A370_SCOMX